ASCASRRPPPRTPATMTTETIAPGAHTTERPGTRSPLTRTALRVPFLLPGGIALLAGLDAALALLGLPHVLVGARLADVHGPLVVLGLVGTVVGLERAVALGRAWGYVSPAVSGLGALAVVSVLPFQVGAALLVLAQVLALLVYRSLSARQPMPAVAVQVLG